MAVIKFTRHLNRYYPSLGPVNIDQPTLRGVLDDVNKQFPGIIDYILDEQGNIRNHVHVFIGKEAIQDRSNTDIKVDKDSDIYVMQALSGG